jgi:hypothetical protein
MKKLILPFLAALIMSGCSKNPQQDPKPTPTQVAVTVTATGPGQINPNGTELVSPGTQVTVTATPNPGATYTFTDTYNGTTRTVALSGTSYSFSATTDHTVSVVFAATLPSIDTTMLVGSWHYTKVEQGIAGSSAILGWQSQIIASCDSDDYEVYTKSHSYTSYLNGTTCVAGGPTNMDVTGNYSIGSSNIIYITGKLYTSDTNTIDYTLNIAIEKLTADSLIITSPAVYTSPAVITRRHYARYTAHH